MGFDRASLAKYAFQENCTLRMYKRDEYTSSTIVKIRNQLLYLLSQTRRDLRLASRDAIRLRVDLIRHVRNILLLTEKFENNGNFTQMTHTI